MLDPIFTSAELSLHCSSTNALYGSLAATISMNDVRTSLNNFYSIFQFAGCTIRSSLIVLSGSSFSFKTYSNITVVFNWLLAFLFSAQNSDENENMCRNIGRPKLRHLEPLIDSIPSNLYPLSVHQPRCLLSEGSQILIAWRKCGQQHSKNEIGYSNYGPQLGAYKTRFYKNSCC